jgi:hypothetical protein
MTQPSVWDSPDLKSNDNYVKFEQVGDTVSGTVQAVRAHTFDDGKTVAQILLTTDDGEETTLTAGQVRLKAALVEQRPDVGDHLSVKLTQIEKRGGGKTLKHFDVNVTRGTGQPAPAAPAGRQSFDDNPPF